MADSAGNPLASYVHNGKGERTSKTVNGVTTLFVYDLSGNLIGEYTSGGTLLGNLIGGLTSGSTLLREYAYGPSGRLASFDDLGSTYWHHNDHLGTPQAMTDSTGTVVWTMSQTPFGITTVNGTVVTNNLRFPGQYFDAETGLNYNYFRTYDPTLGRYTQHDPIGLDGGMNPYGYVLGNPINGIDPLGLHIQALGTTEEINLINSWLNTFAKMPCDSEVRKRYQAIKDSPILFTIKFFESYRAGEFSQRAFEARIARDFSKHHYGNGSVFNYDYAYYSGPDALAHELLGHGYDALHGDFRDNQVEAISIANEVRRFLGQMERGLYDK